MYDTQCFFKPSRTPIFFSEVKVARVRFYSMLHEMNQGGPNFSIRFELCEKLSKMMTYIVCV